MPQDSNKGFVASPVRNPASQHWRSSASKVEKGVAQSIRSSSLGMTFPWQGVPSGRSSGIVKIVALSHPLKNSLSGSSPLLASAQQSLASVVRPYSSEEKTSPSRVRA